MSDLRDHLLDLLTDCDHEAGCTFPMECTCVVGRLLAVLMTDGDDGRRYTLEEAEALLSEECDFDEHGACRRHLWDDEGKVCGRG